MTFIPTDKQYDKLEELRDIQLNDIIPLENRSGLASIYEDDLDDDRDELENAHKDADRLRGELIADGAPVWVIDMAQRPGTEFEDTFYDG